MATEYEREPSAGSAKKQDSRNHTIPDTENMTSDATESSVPEKKSALQDNIDSKGKNAYYFAHAHKATGPKWDGKVEPKLLGKTESGSKGRVLRSQPSFDPSSNITSYAFSDEEKCVKIYVNVPNVGEDYPNDDDVRLEHSTDSFELTLWRGSPPESQVQESSAEESNPHVPPNSEVSVCERRLAFSSLFGSIEGASFKKKKDRIVITLIKSEVKDWSSIGRK